MVLYLGFLQNGVTQEDFVAPAEALNREQAAAQLMGAYPEPVYRLLTVYPRHELVHMLANLDRWPGLPSKVQPPLAELLAHVQAKQAVVPAHAQARAQQADGGTVVQVEVDTARVREAAQGLRADVQALAARLVSGREAEAEAPTVATSPAQPVAAAPATRISRSAAVAAEPAEPLIEKPKSLIEVLRGMRG